MADFLLLFIRGFHFHGRDYCSGCLGALLLDLIMEVNSMAWFECLAMEDGGGRVRLASYIWIIVAFANLKQKLSGKFEPKKRWMVFLTEIQSWVAL